MLCGQLVFLNYHELTVKQESGIKKAATRPPQGELHTTIGLLPCGGGPPLIFKIRPRELVVFYQFRNPTIEQGQNACVQGYGCLNQYITNFDNFVGMNSCSECGLYNQQPTWTHVPLTPFTATPIPPTQALILANSATPTETLTPTSGPATPTPGLFELLHGTPSPEVSTATPTRRPSPTATPVSQAKPILPCRSPLGAGLLSLLGAALLFRRRWNLLKRI
jgi:hypothetical protein